MRGSDGPSLARCDKGSGRGCGCEIDVQGHALGELIKKFFLHG